MKNNKLLQYLIIAAVLLIIVAVIGKKAGWFGGEVLIKVSVEKPEKREINELVTASGKVQPETEVKISPDVSGEIVELNIAEGDDVQKGDLLLKIKPDIYLSAVDRTRASVNSTKANYANSQSMLEQVVSKHNQTQKSFERSKILWEQKTISEADYEAALSAFEMIQSELEAAKKSVEAAKYAVQSADATLKEAEENLKKTTIYAPMSGTISKLNVEKGERVVGTMQMPGTEILRIADLNRMEVKVEVNENDIIKVKLNDTAFIEIDAYLGESFKGIVTEIANSANVSGMSVDQVTSFDVKVLLLKESYEHLKNKGKLNPFRPGMSASVDIQTNTKQGILTIPIQAVTTRVDSVEIKGEMQLEKSNNEAKEMVFVIAGDSVVLQPVKTGIQDNKYIEIVSGLSPEDQVVIAPYSAISRKLKKGSKVTIVDKDKLFEEKD
ncbi:MAG: efflux transporter periplasmic adaptor subunit [Bacteroidetes bacterium GWF2_33_16]|nr:MAG: efflux transporter periplasmic adaptor subunit [Bacteroidetes bacterium GWE2_32_14]OFY04765.1 MAG: efflux transporter periplasmic adaptor subunit [Bacteroidetes bacterium GWF2_33_16]